MGRGESTESRESRSAGGNEGVARQADPPSAWYFRVVPWGPFTAMPLRSHLEMKTLLLINFFFFSVQMNFLACQ